MPRANVLSEEKVKFRRDGGGPGPPCRGGRGSFPEPLAQEYPCTVYTERQVQFVRTGRGISL